MKRILSLLFAVVLILTTLTSCSLQHFSFESDTSGVNGNDSNVDADGGEYITKAEWAEMLGTYFGMDSCMNSEPYYTDVSSSNPAFPYVQSCVEWEVFGLDQKEFRPNDYATVEFVVESAVIASEILGDNNTDAFEYASQHDVVEADRTAYVTKSYAALIAQWAYNLYADKEFVEYENVAFQDTIIDLSDFRCSADGVIELPSTNADLKVGSVVITAPTSMDPYGVARKISSISISDNGEMIIETEEPEIGDIYTELEFAHVGTITDPSTVQTAEGVTLTGITNVSNFSSTDKPVITTLGYSSNQNANIQQLESEGTNLGFSVKLSKGGKATFSPAYNEAVASIVKGDNSEAEKEAAQKLLDKTGFFKPLGEGTATIDGKEIKAIDKYSAGWELEGSLALNNFYVEAELTPKKAFGVPYGIKSFTYEIHYEVVSSLKFSGKLLEEEISIATVPIPLGGTGITIDVEICANASMNGDIEISASIANTSTVKYTEKNGYKKTQSSQCDNSVELTVSFKVGFGGKATLKALGIELIDFNLDVGIGLDGSAKLTRVMRSEGGVYKYDGAIAELEGLSEDVMLCFDGTAYFPTVSLSLGTSSGTLANKLGIKFTWKIMDKSGATFKSQIHTLHYEPENGFVDECSIDTYEVITDEDVSNELEDDKQVNTDKVGNEVMGISHYAVTLSMGETIDLSVTTLPYGYVGYDITWESCDESIVVVNNIREDENSAICTISAVGSGVTSITISTADGKHQLKCAVTVLDNGNIDYNPIG